MKKFLQTICIIALCFMLVCVSAVGIRSVLNKKTKNQAESSQKVGTVIYVDGEPLDEFDLDAFMEDLDLDSNSGTVYKHHITVDLPEDAGFFIFELYSSNGSSFNDLSSVPEGVYWLISGPGPDGFAGVVLRQGDVLPYYFDVGEGGAPLEDLTFVSDVVTAI